MIVDQNGPQTLGTNTASSLDYKQKTFITVHVLKLEILLHFLPKFCIVTATVAVTVFIGMANSRDPDQTAPSGTV